MLQDEFSPAIHIPGIIQYVLSLLMHPIENFMNPEATELYFYNYEEYWAKAKSWTEQFA
eukprot:CAMPEP_0168319142 /NCGR_PEP_ID=MMETSP0213-20121227/884_1 /TAXON_ID=151035 /ORGANISM="Euplotes harpa, Strain FSP1.4" /LENGTH=58 /DNA_ID=CAMNT_0008320315 /DNA_START=438 /DNA_END=614 /DNA_ORIENTATION=+